jgi:hypothetical protein
VASDKERMFFELAHSGTAWLTGAMSIM